MVAYLSYSLMIYFGTPQLQLSPNMSKKSKLNDNKKLMNKVNLDTLPKLSPDLQFDHGLVRNAAQTSAEKELTTILQKDADSQIVLKLSEIATSTTKNDTNQEKRILQSQALLIESLLWIIGSTYENEPSKRARLLDDLFSFLRKYNFIGPPSDTKPNRLRRFQQQFSQKIDKQIRRLLNNRGFQSSSSFPYIYPVALNHKRLSTKKELEIYDYYSNNFEEIGPISRGGFGIVKKARHRVDGKEYAIKIIQIPGVDDKDFFGQFSLKQREVARNADLGLHKNIVAYKTSWLQWVSDNDSECANGSSFSERSSDNEISVKTSPQQTADPNAIRSKFFGSSASSSSSSSSSELRSSEKAKKNKLTLFIQMELCGENLRTYLQKRNEEPNFHVDMNKEIAYFKQILNGVQYIHSKKLIHRDLKPPNILFSLDGKLIKIADFGLAAQLQLIRPIDASSILSTGIGTTAYAAPEQISGTNQQQSKYDHRVDIYSLGIILFEMVYPMKTSYQLSKCLEDLKKNRKLPQDLFDPESCPISNLIMQMTEHEPLKRPKNIGKIYEFIGNKKKKKDAQKNTIQRLQSELEDLRQKLAKALEKH